MLAALLVGFDAVVPFDACRPLGASPAGAADPVEEMFRSLLPENRGVAAGALAAAWRSALLSVADGSTREAARAGLEYVVDA